MRYAKKWGVVVAAALMTTVAGCSSSGPDRADDGPTPTAEASELHLGPSESVQGAGTDAATVAREALAAWAQPTLTRDEWWDALAPFMADGAEQAYSFTDPSVLPTLTIASSSARDTGNVTYSVIDVLTDKGPVAVRLTRPNAASGWKVTRFELTELDWER